MSDQSDNQEKFGEGKGRPVGDTELSWYKAVSSGTGIAVLAFQLSKEPDTLLLQDALHKIQNAHPILRSKLHKNPTTNSFSINIKPPNSDPLQIESFNISRTSNLLSKLPDSSLSPFHKILEHELNDNPWTDLSSLSCTSTHMIYSNLYTLPGTKWVLVIRLPTAVCDHTTGASLLRELMGLMVGREAGGIGSKGEVSLGIEDLIPIGKAKKALWAHGMDMLGYSVNSLKLTNLKFKDVKRPRRSQVVRLKLIKEDTQKLVDGCNLRGIKLCGALAAAGLIAGYSSKGLYRKMYGVVTLTDCRSILEPSLSVQHFGFYYSAVLNIHSMKGGETLWELGKRCYEAFANSKKCNKHFSDMADLNFLMCKAIGNPALTSSSSLRTSLISVFEDTVIEESIDMQRELGLEDFVGCASVHGVGPSIAVFDTIKDGELDCAFVYPSPLHSREQIQELVDNMKRVLLEASCI